MRHKDDDLREELRSHLEMAEADRVARGQSPSDAAADARRELGNLSQIQEAARDQWGGRWLVHAAQDLRYAIRLFRRSPGFTFVAMLSLALGIGANSALFRVVDALRLQTLPVSDPDGLAQVRLADMDGARGNFHLGHPSVTYPIWQAIQARQQSFAGLFAWSADTFNLSAGGEMRLAHGLWVTGDLFNVLGVRPAAGRLLMPDDDRPGCAPRAVLSYPFWQQAYTGNPAVVGQTLTLDGHPVEIVGVTAPGFAGLDVGKSFDFAIPVCMEGALNSDGSGRLASGTDWWLNVFGRLKAGWRIDAASAHLSAISPELFRSTLPPKYPAVSVPKYLGFRLIAVPGASGVSQLREAYAAPLWLLLGIAGLVLLIACANLANLLLARATARQREIAVRLGLGASRGRILRQLLTESVALAALGGAAGGLLATVLSRAFVGLLDTQTSTTTLPLGTDWRVLAFTSGLSLLTCLLFGLAPAVNATRIGASALMRATTRGATASRDAAGVRRTLVVAQVALSMVLLFGSLLFARSLHNLIAVDPGFNADGVIAAGIDFRRLEVPADRRAAFRQDLLERVRGLAGVQSAAVVGVLPASGSSSGNVFWPGTDRTRGFGTNRNVVGAGYFSTMGIPMVAGRDFDATDTPGSTPAAIVSETFAAKIGGTRAAIGSRVTREATPGRPEESFTIVGVVKNSTYADLKETVRPVLYMADSQARPAGYVRIAIRSALPAATVTGAITRTLTQIDPRIAVGYRILATDIRESLLLERMLATLSGSFGVLAGVLTLVGLYGLIAYTVTRRTNEIGLRMALGAGRRAIAGLVLRETGTLVAIGAAIGTILALAAAQTAGTLLFGVRPSDPLTLAGAVAVLAAIALAASYAPARRATRIEPVEALRAD
ncbi:MAG TPA: ABC transporter permease [Vicinamibacterales bacterium]|nr:ABC transporter permease [Vicinamibacterales bacterium]